MKKILISLIIAISLVSGFTFAEDIRVISKQTIGIDYALDFKVRMFRICIDGIEFVQSFTVCPKYRKPYLSHFPINSHLIQVYEVSEDGRSIPKKCPQ